MILQDFIDGLIEFFLFILFIALVCAVPLLILLVLYWLIWPATIVICVVILAGALTAIARPKT